MKTLYKFLATAFGSGYSPIAPGTAGAAVGAVILWLVYNYLPDVNFTNFLIIGNIVVFVIGVYVSNQLEPDWGKDPSKIVIDEVSGMWITMLFVVPFTLTNLIIGFFLFRLFDIWKPLFIRKLEPLPGGWGVMLDDVLAGIYANIVLQAIVYFVLT